MTSPKASCSNCYIKTIFTIFGNDHLPILIQNNDSKLQSSPDTCDPNLTKLYFLKTHKTASSVIENILLRSEQIQYYPNYYYQSSGYKVTTQDLG